MDSTTLIILSAYGAVLMAVSGVVFRQTSQIAVLQKTVDSMVSKMDIFLKTEIDAFKEIARQNKG